MLEKKLRASLFGYKKDAVHAYIQEMSDNAAVENKKCADDLQAAQKEIAELKESFSAAAAANEREIANLRAMLDENQKTMEGLQQQSIVLAEEKAQTLRLLREHEIEKNAISQALIVAQQKAGNIITDARSTAEDIMEKLAIDKEEQLRIAAIEMENAKTEIRKTAGELVTLKEQVISAMQKYKSELDYIISEYKI